MCATGAQKQSCWRYPLAQALLAKDGVSHANFVQIAAATSQREFTTSVYTNIHNLATGEIWFYLAEEYQTPWHTSVPALLKQGPRHILLASQFPHNASRRLAQVMQTTGSAAAVHRFLEEEDSFSASEKESQLRLAFLDNFYIEKDFANARVLFPFGSSICTPTSAWTARKCSLPKPRFWPSMARIRPRFRC
ncbi:hypothetical protein [Hymenobacter volaticus]|uniref:Uncharacterized protein n=1 Tax=Hymenobacter volaticus TaxID=2932254 RepID=A0ABY4GET1_9BACT|nr:hypothetical protein [Hymenobacter volaticus]UOQ69305.1 hypothetical protein MUN86_26770 [Hymenobacter volaticus]